MKLPRRHWIVEATVPGHKPVVRGRYFTRRGAEDVRARMQAMNPTEHAWKVRDVRL